MKSIIIYSCGDGVPHGKNYCVAWVHILEFGDILRIPESENTFIFYNDTLKDWIHVSVALSPVYPCPQIYALRAVEEFINGNSHNSTGSGIYFFPPLVPFMDKFPLLYIIRITDLSHTYVAMNGNVKLFTGNRKELINWLGMMGIGNDLSMGFINEVRGINLDEL